MMNDEIKAVMNRESRMKCLGLGGVAAKFYKTFMEELTAMFLNLFHEIEKQL
jgi:hypothetical protein